MNTTRTFQYAGSFYPDKTADIKAFIKAALDKAVLKGLPSQKPKIVIVPHAGYAYSGQIAAYAYKVISQFNYRNIFLLGPSHYVFASNEILTCSFGHFETPLGTVATFKPQNLPALFKDNDNAHALEHSLEVQLPFLQYLDKNYRIFPQLTNEDNETSLSIVSNFESDFLDNSDDNLLIISSDLSHYHEYREAQRKDKQTIENILLRDDKGLEERGEACGLMPIVIGLKIAQKLNLKPILLKAANSGDVSGSFGAPVVGYAAFAFY